MIKELKYKIIIKNKKIVCIVIFGLLPTKSLLYKYNSLESLFSSLAFALFHRLSSIQLSFSLSKYHQNH